MTTLAEVLDRQADETITGLTVCVRSAGRVFDNEGQYGAYRSQTLTVEDETAVCELRWTDPTFAPGKGDYITVSAVRGQRGLTGAKVGEYKGKKNIRATGGAVTPAQGAIAPSPPQAATAAQAPLPMPAPAQHQHRKPERMTEAAACRLLFRNLERLVGMMTDLDLQGDAEHPPNLIQEAPPHVLAVAGPMATSVLIAANRGDVEVDPE